MVKDTGTLVLNGEVTLEDFSKVLSGFVGVMKAHRQEVAAGKQIDWILSDLQAGSAIATARGEVEGGGSDGD